MAFKIILYDKVRSLIALIGVVFTVFIVVDVEDGASVENVVSRLRERLQGGFDVYTRSQFSRKTRLYWMVETGIGFSFLITILVSFIIGVLIVGQTIYNSTMEHLRDFETLKAIGATSLDISRIIFSGALIKATFGYIIGLVITLISTRLYQVTEMVFAVNIQIALLVFVLTLIMCISAAFISVRKIRRIEPALVFRG